MSGLEDRDANDAHPTTRGTEFVFCSFAGRFLSSSPLLVPGNAGTTEKLRFRDAPAAAVTLRRQAQQFGMQPTAAHKSRSGCSLSTCCHGSTQVIAERVRTGPRSSGLCQPPTMLPGNNIYPIPSDSLVQRQRPTALDADSSPSQPPTSRSDQKPH